MPASQTAVGYRAKIKFPGWFAIGAVDAIRERIDELAEPRDTSISVDFPMDQRNGGPLQGDRGAGHRRLFPSASCSDTISGVDLLRRRCSS